MAAADTHWNTFLYGGLLHFTSSTGFYHTSTSIILLPNYNFVTYHQVAVSYVIVAVTWVT